jgi:enoyl-CoA hydratase
VTWQTVGDGGLAVDGLTIAVTDGVALITLDRPPVNALTMVLYRKLTTVFETLGETLDVNCAILTAAGTRAFCAGKDVREFLATTVEQDIEQAPIVRRAFSAIRDCRIPVIAAVNGPALGGGCALAAVCDIRIASHSARFALPEVNIGRCGGGAHVGPLVPPGILRRMFFTAEAIDAAEAYRIGLVDQVEAPEDLMPAALRLARTIATKSPLGLRLGKQALNEIESLPFEDACLAERRYAEQLLRTEDAREAARAVAEKRAPVFSGR